MKVETAGGKYSICSISKLVLLISISRNNKCILIFFSADFSALAVLFTSYQDITETPSPPTALSAKTVAIMAHNKGLELGADMVLLLWGRQGRGAGGG